LSAGAEGHPRAAARYAAMASSLTTMSRSSVRAVIRETKARPAAWLSFDGVPSGILTGPAARNFKGRASSGYRGAHRMRDKWQARGKLGGTEFYLGTYRTPEEAAAVVHAWRLANLPGYTGQDITRGKADDVPCPISRRERSSTSSTIQVRRRRADLMNELSINKFDPVYRSGQPR
jgi:hypothetical protein